MNGTHGFKQDHSIARILSLNLGFEEWLTRLVQRIMNAFTDFSNSDSGSKSSHNLWQKCEMLYMLLLGDYHIRKMLKEEHCELLEFFLRGKKFREQLEQKQSVYDNLTLSLLHKISDALED